MKDRCYRRTNRSWHRYGGRGISICKRWGSYENFIADMGEPPSADHSIDRIDYNGHYEPKNCRWATRTQQANNSSRNRRTTIFGITKNISEWAREAGLKRATLARRIEYGWPEELLLSPEMRLGSKKVIKPDWTKIERRMPRFNARSNKITYNGETRTLTEWAEHLGIKRSTLSNRINAYGQTVEQAFSTCLQKTGPKTRVTFSKKPITVQQKENS